MRIYNKYITYNYLILFSRVYQFVKIYIFNPSSALFSCPNAMTDGAAFLIKELQSKSPSLVSEDMRYAFERLTSNNPKHFWTSGQWVI